MPDRKSIADDIPALINSCAPLYALYSKVGMPIIYNREEGFASLVHIILEQQVSLSSAKNALDRLISGMNKELTPDHIHEFSTEEIRSWGITRQKASYIKGLAATILAGDINLSSLSEMSTEKARESLMTLKGIGRWTADVYLLMCLGHRDIFPTGDIALINEMKHLSLIQSTAEIQKVSEAWQPYRSAASFLIWHSYLIRLNRL